MKQINIGKIPKHGNLDLKKPEIQDFLTQINTFLCMIMGASIGLTLGYIALAQRNMVRGQNIDTIRLTYYETRPNV